MRHPIIIAPTGALEKEMATLLQYSCLENPMDGGAWWATVHGVAKSWTRLSDFTSLLQISKTAVNIRLAKKFIQVFL